jgi:hypothetical protein
MIGDKNIPLLLNPIAKLSKQTDLISLFFSFYSRIFIAEQDTKQ